MKFWVRLMEQELENFEEEHGMVLEILRGWEDRGNSWRKHSFASLKVAGA